MKLPRLALLGLLLGAAAVPAAARAATTFRWANNGDVTAMDPDTLQETVQLSFLSNIYEPLVQRNRDLKLEPGLAVKWRQVSPTVWRFHLRPGVKWQDGTPFTAADVVFSVHRMEAKTSHMRDVLGMVAGRPRGRPADGGVHHQAPRPDLPAGADQSAHHEQGVVREARRDGAGGAGRRPELRHPARDGHRAVQARVPPAGQQDDRRPQQAVVGQAQPQGAGSGRVRRDQERLHPGRRAALGRGGHDLHRAAAGHGRASPMRPGVEVLEHPEVAHDLLRLRRVASGAADQQRQGQEPAPGRAGAPRLRAGDRRGPDRQAGHAGPGASDLADVGPGGERLRPQAGCAAEDRRRGGEEADGRGGLSARLHHRHGLPERPLRDGRADLHRRRRHAGADRGEGESRRADQGQVLRQDPGAEIRHRLLHAGLDARDLRRRERALLPARHPQRRARRDQRRRLFQSQARRADREDRRPRRTRPSAMR